MQSFILMQNTFVGVVKLSEPFFLKSALFGQCQTPPELSRLGPARHTSTSLKQIKYNITNIKNTRKIISLNNHFNRFLALITLTFSI